MAYTVGLLAGLLLAASAVGWLLDLDGTSELTPARRLCVGLIWLAIAVALAVTWRRLRGWSGRPRWLVPAAAALAIAGLAPAVIAPAPAPRGFITHCVPVADAWLSVMPPPAAADLAYLRSHPKPSRDGLLGGRQARAAYTAAFNVWLSAPQHERVESYRLWQLFSGPCAQPARIDLGRSAAGLGLGALALTVAVRRRRG